MCPRHVILAGYRPGGKRATCKECKATYKKPQQDRSIAAKGPKGASTDVKRLAEVEKKLAATEKLLKEATSSQNASEAEGPIHEAASSAASDIQGAIDKIVQKIKFLRSIPDEHKDEFASPSGEDLASRLASLEAKKQELLAQKRGTLPLAVQKANAKRRLDATNKHRSNLQAETSKSGKQIAALVEQQELLAAKIIEVEARLVEDQAALKQIEFNIAKEAGAIPITITAADAMHAQAPPEVVREMGRLLSFLDAQPVQKALVVAGILQAERAELDQIRSRVSSALGKQPLPEFGVSSKAPSEPVAEPDNGFVEEMDWFEGMDDETIDRFASSTLRAKEGEGNDDRDERLVTFTQAARRKRDAASSRKAAATGLHVKKGSVK